MTIQDKINQLRDYLSNESDTNFTSERESIQSVIKEASKIFESGDISRMDPELLEVIYEKWNGILDSQLNLFLEFTTENKHLV